MGATVLAFAGTADGLGVAAATLFVAGDVVVGVGAAAAAAAADEAAADGLLSLGLSDLLGLARSRTVLSTLATSASFVGGLNLAGLPAGADFAAAAMLFKGDGEGVPSRSILVVTLRLRRGLELFSSLA